MKKSTYFQSSSPQQTKRFAADFARRLKTFALEKGAVVIALKGDLGAGKTTFVQGFAKALGVKERVLSPTFLIVKEYGRLVQSLSSHNQIKILYHIDCYRIGAKDLKNLGWKEIISNPRAIVLVEWADRVKNILPKNTFWLSFSYDKAGPTRRSITTG